MLIANYLKNNRPCDEIFCSRFMHHQRLDLGVFLEDLDLPLAVRFGTIAVEEVACTVRAHVLKFA